MAKPASRAPINELRQFAGWFHQDCGLLFKDFRAGAAMYTEDLTPDRRKALRLALSAFLAAHTDVPPNTLKRLWIKQGAQWCESGINMREALNEVVRTLG